MPVAPIGKIKIHYETYGDPEAYSIVLVHPIGGNILIWEEEIKLLVKSGFRVIAYELRGYHRTELGRIGAYAIQELVEDLRLLLQYLKIDRCSIVGHSIGGIIASMYAAEYYSDRQKIDAIVLINSSPRKIPDQDLEKHFKTREIAISKGIEALAEYTLKKDKQSRDLARSKEKSDFFKHVFTKTTVEGFVAATLALYTIPENVTARLKTTGCKVLGIVGREDDVFLRLLTETRQEMPEMELEVIEGSDHWLVIEKPKTMYNFLFKFLSGVIQNEN
jgi:3-oxoadipate enol-lactonase